MGFAEVGKTIPAEPVAVEYAPIPQWRRRHWDRVELSNLVFEGSDVCISCVREHVTGARRNLVG